MFFLPPEPVLVLAPCLQPLDPLWPEGWPRSAPPLRPELRSLTVSTVCFQLPFLHFLLRQSDIVAVTRNNLEEGEKRLVGGGFTERSAGELQLESLWCASACSGGVK